MFNVIECQNPIARVIAPLVHEMNGNTAASLTVMVEYGINEWLYLSQVQTCPILREEADAACWNIAGESEGAAEAIETQTEANGNV